jgi:hypothetical protein
MTTETPPDEVLLEAAKRANIEEEPIEYLRKIYPRAGSFRALCDMIETHEAFKQEVSDTVESITSAAVDPTVWRKWASDRLSVFITPKPKPDPLVEVLTDLNWLSATNKFRTALEARGLEIRKKQP